MDSYCGTFQNLAELEKHVGQELGLSNWITVTQAQIDQFAVTTGDEQWIHIDPIKCAAESPYQNTIAHGFLVLSLASKLCQECYRIDSVLMAINYGLDKVRFPHPTAVGSKIRTRVTLKELNYKGAAALLKLHVVFELENISKPACVADWVLLLHEKRSA